RVRVGEPDPGRIDVRGASKHAISQFGRQFGVNPKLPSHATVVFGVSVTQRWAPAGPEARKDEVFNDFDDFRSKSFFGFLSATKIAFAKRDIEFVNVGHELVPPCYTYLNGRNRRLCSLRYARSKASARSKSALLVTFPNAARSGPIRDCASSMLP